MLTRSAHEEITPDDVARVGDYWLDRYKASIESANHFKGGQLESTYLDLAQHYARMHRIVQPTLLR